MKRVVVVLCGLFAVALAAVIGFRMSADAMAVLVGVACGVLASIPTSLLIVWALARRDQAGHAGHATMRNYPPIVVVNPGIQHAPTTYGLPALPPAAPYVGDGGVFPTGQRVFRVLGDEETPGNRTSWY
jgi:hypothetical protein